MFCERDEMRGRERNSELSQFLLIPRDFIHENKLMCGATAHSRFQMHNLVFLAKQSCEGQ